jgi:hypothetical protein
MCLSAMSDVRRAAIFFQGRTSDKIYLRIHLEPVPTTRNYLQCIEQISAPARFLILAELSS